MFEYEDLDIAASPDDILVSTVNTVGVTGAGVAKAVADAYPEAASAYRKACESGRLRPGALHSFQLEDGRRILHMATKEHWKAPSQPHWAGSGLILLAAFLARMDRQGAYPKSLTLPLPGAGHGGLDPARVDLMARACLAPAVERGLRVRVPHAPIDTGPIAPVYAGVGAQKTPVEVQGVMRDLAERLSDDGWLLRSGGAVGADQAFACGARGRARIYFADERGAQASQDPGERIVHIPDTHYRIMRAFHPAPERLSPFAERLQARNTSQVFGGDLMAPADIVICWTEGGRGRGGTGQAIRLAGCVGIPVMDLGRPEYQEVPAKQLHGQALQLVEARRARLGVPSLRGATTSPEP